MPFAVSRGTIARHINKKQNEISGVSQVKKRGASLQELSVRALASFGRREEQPPYISSKLLEVQVHF